MDQNEISTRWRKWKDGRVLTKQKERKMSPVYDNLALIFLKGPGLLCLVEHVNAGFRISLVPEIKISSNT